ncbi:MAG: hypothetical protein HeimC3_09460 [Candidatus Heimdallarchaeota archaeon LC_3]|nr:MAG: hypothetical protein HeimC3_09460 [Candidatus Heimdallarchaeota archaeon LC_3]
MDTTTPSDNVGIDFRFFVSSSAKDIYSHIKNNKINYFFLALFIVIPFAYELIAVFYNVTEYDEYLRTTTNYIVLDEYLTVFAQKTFGTVDTFIGYSSAIFYTFGFLGITATAYILLLTAIIRDKKYRLREPYIYILIVIIMFVIDMSGYWFFPTAPPVRIFSDLHYRISIFPAGDSLIAIKYNAFPSGHGWALAVPYLAAKAENFKFLEKLYAVGLIITSWVVLQTGDHYIIDVIASFTLCVIFYIILTSIFDYKNNKDNLASKDELKKRFAGLFLVILGLLFVGVFTLTKIEPLFIFQLLAIVLIWPLLIIKTNTSGLLNSQNQVKRSAIDDYKDILIKVRNKIQISNSKK